MVDYLAGNKDRVLFIKYAVHFLCFETFKWDQ